MLKKQITLENINLSEEMLLIKNFKPSFIIMTLPLLLFLLSYIIPFSKNFHYIFSFIYFLMTIHYIYKCRLSFISKNEIKININFSYLFCFFPNFSNININNLKIKKVKIFFIEFYIISYKNKANNKNGIFVSRY
ncbi:MAG: hypothetical protein DCC88_03250 [Spirobacillus cienkowskii]|jgi:hypothetical protein|uniref:Uncharacterized protein n=1 Tax=Spirobacillus cienkowskii TaxID=495820 RepID=A0A369KT76_9BACT|nr:MAG: hypothetical protein DCC88_03250 [Spirobacillus cienkowskii]